MHFTRNAALAGLAAIPLTVAQTYTDCNPTKKDCPNDTGLNSASWSCDFTKGESASASWSTAVGTKLTYDGTKGAEFTIKGKNQAPTISSDFYIFFGKVEVTMQAANGTGIVSSMVLQSEDLDEIDWEWLGGDVTQAQTNYFGKGNTTSYDRGSYESVSTPQSTMHTYAFDWTQDKIDWIIDGNIVRTLHYADAVGGQNFPQTPMRLKLGNWIGGDPDTNAEGTIEWAGGETDFSQVPFVMYVQSVSVTNYNPAKEYEWSDKTGSYQSIKLIDSSSSGSSSSGSSSSASSSASSASSSGSSSVPAKSPVSIKSTAVISDKSNTVAPTSSISVKQAQAQGSAAVVSNSSSIASATGSTLTSVVSSSASGSDSHTSGSASASKTSAHSSSSATSSQPAQQSGNAATSNAVAAGLFSAVGVIMAFFAL